MRRKSAGVGYLALHLSVSWPINGVAMVGTLRAIGSRPAPVNCEQNVMMDIEGGDGVE